MSMPSEPITLLDSEPEPDVVVVRGNTRDYLDRHPGSQDLALVVEIADSTLERDRSSKNGSTPVQAFRFIGSSTFLNKN
jgi:Uma2 family endonuclease